MIHGSQDGGFAGPGEVPWLEGSAAGAKVKPLSLRIVSGVRYPSLVLTAEGGIVFSSSATGELEGWQGIKQF